MNTNIQIPLTDDERSHLHNIYHNTKSKTLISRKEVTALVLGFIDELKNGDTDTIQAIPKNIIKEGYKYFINDEEVSAKQWFNIEEKD